MNADFKPKFIAWYEDDFRADRIVQRMTPVQRSFYRNLIIESYYNEARPYLPTDDSKLWELADAENVEQWQDNKKAVLVKFTEVSRQDGTKVFQNKRVLEEWEVLERRLEQKKLAGAASVRARRERVKSENPPQTPPTVQNNTTHHNTTGRSTPVNERSTSVRWVVDLFKTLGQVPDRTKVEALFEGREDEAVKGTAEYWKKKTNLKDTTHPFSKFVREFESFYNPTQRTDDFIEKRELAKSADEQAKIAREEETNRQARILEREELAATAQLF